MMRRWLMPVVMAALSLAMLPAEARTLSSRSFTLTAPVPCAVACPYGLGLDETGDNVPEFPLDTCTNPGPPQSFADKVVKAPRYARVLRFQAYPVGDWDIFVCAKPRRGNNGKLLAKGYAGFVGARETINLRVRAGRYYVLRGYNYSDGPELKARYWFFS